MMPSGAQIAICVAIFIVVFGGKRIIDIFSAGGKSLKDFKEAVDE